MMLTPSIDTELFTQISPFNSENPLGPKVQSDHVEIALETKEGAIINIWNISNPTYHEYYQYGSNPPFHRTHLFVASPFVEGKMDEGLAAKAESQAATLSERFVKGLVNIQVIVEGCESFLSLLADKITSLGCAHFAIISLLDKKPAFWDPQENVTAILIDTSRFEILESGTVMRKYFEEQDSGREKDFVLPFAYVRSVISDQSFVIAGVHLAGCGSQFPKTGLEVLAIEVQGLRDRIDGAPDIITAGDYNTPIENARRSLVKTREMVLKAPYLTHVNPRSQAANYDQVVVFPGDRPDEYRMLSVEYLSEGSQQLVDSIRRSSQYLEEHA